MAVLENIRVKLGVFITVIIAIALLSFIIDPTTLQNVSASMSSKYDVGQIGGNSVSYQDFQKEVESFTALNEMISGQSVRGEEQQSAMRDAVWQSYVDKYLFLKNARNAGIRVGKEEMVSLTTGDMPSPVVAGNPVFFDETGSFSADRLVQIVQQASSDPTIKAYWDYLQNSVYTQQMYAKYGSLFTESAVSGPLQASRSIAENNTTADIDFVMVPYGFAQDTTITVSGKEIKKYYKDHRKFFRQQAGRDIEYVVFQVVPSAEDIAEAEAAFADSYEEFLSADNMKSFLLRNSDRQLSDYWYKAGELRTVNAELDKAIFTDNQAVTSVVRSGDTFYAAKVMETKSLPDSVFVRHILLQGTNEALADSLLNVVKTRRNSFANVAALYSADQNPNVAERGDLGWMTQTYMIPGMESVLEARAGAPFILDTQYGKHIVEVTMRTAPVSKKRIAVLEKEAIASKTTYNSFYAQANEVATAAKGKYESFKAHCDEAGLYTHPMNNVREGNSSYGAIDSAKEVTRWIYDAKAGQVSNIITVNNDYFFVVALKEIHKEGYAKVSEVSSSIRDVIYYDRLGDRRKAEVAEKIQGLGSLQAIAEVLETTVSSRDNISFAAMATSSIDPALVGAVACAEEGVICGPVNGAIGTYVFKVNGREEGSFYTAEDVQARNAQFTQYSLQSLVPVMMDDADVKDNRARFY